MPPNPNLPTTDVEIAKRKYGAIFYHHRDLVSYSMKLCIEHKRNYIENLANGSANFNRKDAHNIHLDCPNCNVRLVLNEQD